MKYILLIPLFLLSILFFYGLQRTIQLSQRRYYWVVLSQRNRKDSYAEKRFVLRSTNPQEAERYLDEEFIPEANKKESIDYVIYDIRKI